ncbi:MAG: class F sortase [Dehalococcoidia bacterium]
MATLVLGGLLAFVVAFVAGVGPFGDSENTEAAGIVVTPASIPEPEPAQVQRVAAPREDAVPFTLPAIQALVAEAPEPELGGLTGMSIVIPKLDVNQATTTMGIYADGETFQVPNSAHEVAWYNFSGAPGSNSANAIFAGHINYYGRQGTFRWISTLVEGDTVEIHQIDGTVHVYRVLWARQIYKPSLSWEDVGCRPGAGCTSQNTITLITCGGAFDRGSGHYIDNTVVRAELVETRHAIS